MNLFFTVLTFNENEHGFTYKLETEIKGYKNICKSIKICEY